MTNSILTQEYLQECFIYNPVTGSLIWKDRPPHHFKSKSSHNSFKTQFSGKQVGCARKYNTGKSYFCTCIKNKGYLVHRLIFALINSVWPDEIDHIDGDGLNNKLDNLRATDKSGNQKNARRRSDNKSGITGVSWHKINKMWIAIIAGKTIGSFANFNDAAIARKMAEYNLGYHINHGSNRPL